MLAQPEIGAYKIIVTTYENVVAAYKRLKK